MFSSLMSKDTDVDDDRQPILLVAPNPRASLVEALEGAGYKVLSYDHPMTALEDIGNLSVKVAIVAEELPWLKGDALARTLRESYRLNNVILMEGDMSDSSILAQIRSGSPAKTLPEKPKVRQRRTETATTSRTGRRIIVRRSARS